MTQQVVPRRTVVVAPDRTWFIAWCADNRRSPRDRALICIVGPHDEPKVFGLCDFDIVVLGECHRHAEVMAFLHHRRRVPATPNREASDA